MTIFKGIKDPIDINMLNLHKMLFIYNAILNGWTVKMITNNNFEFIKDKKKVKKKILLDNYLQYFIDKNFNINNIIK